MPQQISTAERPSPSDIETHESEKINISSIKRELYLRVVNQLIKQGALNSPEGVGLEGAIIGAEINQVFAGVDEKDLVHARMRNADNLEFFFSGYLQNVLERLEANPKFSIQAVEALPELESGPEVKGTVSTSERVETVEFPQLPRMIENQINQTHLALAEIENEIHSKEYLQKAYTQELARLELLLSRPDAGRATQYVSIAKNFTEGVDLILIKAHGLQSESKIKGFNKEMRNYYGTESFVFGSEKFKQFINSIDVYRSSTDKAQEYSPEDLHILIANLSELATLGLSSAQEVQAKLNKGNENDPALQKILNDIDIWTRKILFDIDYLRKLDQITQENRTKLIAGELDEDEEIFSLLNTRSIKKNKEMYEGRVAKGPAVELADLPEPDFSTTEVVKQRKDPGIDPNELFEQIEKDKLNKVEKSKQQVEFDEKLELERLRANILSLNETRLQDKNAFHEFAYPQSGTDGFAVKLETKLRERSEKWQQVSDEIIPNKVEELQKMILQMMEFRGEEARTKEALKSIQEKIHKLQIEIFEQTKGDEKNLALKELTVHYLKAFLSQNEVLTPDSIEDINFEELLANNKLLESSVITMMRQAYTETSMENESAYSYLHFEAILLRMNMAETLRQLKEEKYGTDSSEQDAKILENEANNLDAGVTRQLEKIEQLRAERIKNDARIRQIQVGEQNSKTVREIQQLEIRNGMIPMEIETQIAKVMDKIEKLIGGIEGLDGMFIDGVDIEHKVGQQVVMIEQVQRQIPEVSAFTESDYRIRR